MKGSLISILFCLLTFSSICEEKLTYSVILNKSWFIQSSESAPESGNVISTSRYIMNNRFETSVPATVLGALVMNKVYKDIFKGENLKLIPGDQFKKPWWFRKPFTLPKRKGMNYVKLEIDGINYSADIWLNGKKIAGSDSIAGPFRKFEIDISKSISFGKENVLAVEVFPPKPGDFTIGFVDWNPIPPDRNMGIWREVRLKVSGDVSINHPFVKSRIDLKEFKTASLTISAELENNSEKEISGVLEGQIEGLKFSREIKLDSHEQKLITFNPSDFPNLRINNPRIWWTHDIGKPDLYKLNLSFRIKNEISDENESTFGIREVSDYFTEEGHRGYKLNGKKILIRGGGWVDDLLLRNSYENIDVQIKYAIHSNLNAIRLEGFWGNNHDLYDICDKYGILIMAGWSCQWEWEDYVGKKADEFGAVITPEEIKLIAQSWKDQIKWLRGHPSIFVWLYGSDKLPRPELEAEYQKILSECDSTRPFLASAKGMNSTLTGNTGVKMNGPYDYVPPVYWYIDTLHGGAFGFNTETGPGPQIPVLENIKKFIPADHLWPIDSVWNYHCGGGEFSNLKNYSEVMKNRLGEPNSLDDFCIKSQFLNYEGMRAMFEAFQVRKFKTTGIIQWMFNSAWPKLWWQLFDYYLMPTGAMYGARKANEPIHILYDYGSHAIYAVNNTIHKQDGLRSEVCILNFDMTEKYSGKELFDIQPDEARQVAEIKIIDGLSETYFAYLRLYDKKNKLISTNFYCLSSKEDSLDFGKSKWFVTPESDYADMTMLNKLPDVKLKINRKFGVTKGGEYVTVEIENPAKDPAFQVELILTGNDGSEIVPIFWDDNYFSLLPGEKRIVKGYFSIKNDRSGLPAVKVRGWNVKL
jgi:exo-1,4-beta-D-glucosaminidase